MVQINPTVSPREFVDGIESPRRRRDAETLLELYGAITGEPAVMWGPTIIGFGSYDYVYPSGHSGTAPAAGFSPRKAAITIYLHNSADSYSALLGLLGPHKTSVACLYITNLDKIDLSVLEQIIATSYASSLDRDVGNRERDSSDYR
jgi:hypothetical protein